MLLFLLILIVLFLLYVFSTICRKGHPGLAKLKDWSYAHRGLHRPGVPENSLAAFREAVDAGYGSELDVHLLADGQLAVIHDSLLKRTTGADGRIEDMTSTQLSNYYLEGTSERIPLLQDVLRIYDGKSPLIVELKPVSDNVDMLCRRTCEVLDEYKGSFCVESFDPRCVYWFKKNRPEIVRGQLTENFFLSKTSNLPAALKFAMKAQLFNFMTRPDFVAYRFKDRKTLSNIIVRSIWGAQGVSWTLTTQEEYDTAVKENWIPIFEGFRP